MEIMEASGKVEGGSLGDRQFKAVTASEMAIINPTNKTSTNIIDADFEDAEDTNNDDQRSKQSSKNSAPQQATGTSTISNKEAEIGRAHV